MFRTNITYYKKRLLLQRKMQYLLPLKISFTILNVRSMWNWIVIINIFSHAYLTRGESVVSPVFPVPFTVTGGTSTTIHKQHQHSDIPIFKRRQKNQIQPTLKVPVIGRKLRVYFTVWESAAQDLGGRKYAAVRGQLKGMSVPSYWFNIERIPI